MLDPPNTPHLLYVADPMCSWCYGFQPVVRALADHFGPRLPIRLLMGGLRAGTTRAMRPQDKDYIRSAWERVAAVSGQPFDVSFFERGSFVYDTEPACRAVVTARTLLPSQALAYLGAIQRAFYAANRDITDGNVLSDIAAELGFDGARFATVLLSADMRNETFRDFLTTQQAGIEGFPALLAGAGDGRYAVVTQGFRPLDSIPEALERWLAEPAT